MACRWRLTIAHYQGVIFGVARTAAPIGLLPIKLHSQSVVCTHAKERDAVKIPAWASYLHSREGCIFFFKKQISHYFFF